MSAPRVIAITSRELQWTWEGVSRIAVPAPARAFYGKQVNVDPVPAYAHDVALVRHEALAVARAFPLRVPVTICVLDRESPSRTNGECDIIYDYSKKAKKPSPWAASIVLWGKRIPPHPALTRYLVAHEYGHAVARAISRRRGLAEMSDLYQVYRRFRPGLPRVAYYGPGSWHATIGEVFANDFRILVAGVEEEYWPHPGIPRPSRSVAAWWRAEQKAAK